MACSPHRPKGKRAWGTMPWPPPRRRRSSRWSCTSSGITNCPRLPRLAMAAVAAARNRPTPGWTRWLLEKTVGIAQGRKLPRVASSSFLRRAERRRLTRPTRRTGGKVLHFVDVYANWYDVQLAEAFVAVMEHNNIAVYVHPDQQSSGMNRLALGDVER